MKRSRVLLRLLAVAVPIVMLAVSAAPASAAVSAAAMKVDGAGTIAPGLTAVPAAQMFSFGGWARVTGVLCDLVYVDGWVPVSADGTDVAGSVAEGVGLIDVVIGGCPANGVFVRVGAAVHVALVLPSYTSGSAACDFVPDQLTPPITSYQASCVGTFKQLTWP